MSQMQKKIIDGLIWGVGGRFILLFFNFLTIVVTARLLSPADFGVYASAQVFIELGFAIATSTLGTPIVRAQNLDPEMQHFGFLAFLVVAVIYSAILGFGSPYISALFNMTDLEQVLILIALIMPMRIMSGFYTSVMLQKMDLRWYQISQTLPQILGSLVTIVLAFWGYGLWCLVGGFAVSVVAELLIAVAKAGKATGFPKTIASLHEYWAIGSGSLAARGASVVVANVDRVVIANVLDAVAVGLYTRALSIMMIPFKVITLVSTRIFLTSFSKVTDHESRSRSLEKVLAIQAYVYIPMSAGLWLASDFLVRIALGNKWLECIPLCQILSCALFARLGYEVINNALTAVGRVWVMARRIAITAPLMLLSCIVGQYLGGITGVTIGVTAMQIAIYAASVWLACVEFQCKVKPIVVAHLVATALSIAGGFGAMWFAKFSATFVPVKTLMGSDAPIYFALFIIVAWLAMPKLFLGQRWKDLREWR